MESTQDFFLEQAIWEWQAPLRSSGSFTKDNLAELADHIRDSFDNKPNEDISDKEHFQNIIQQMGDTTSLAAEYSSNNQSYIAKEYSSYFLMGGLGFFMVYLAMKICFDGLSIFIGYMRFTDTVSSIALWIAAIGTFSLFSYLGWRFFELTNKANNESEIKFSRIIKHPSFIIPAFLILFTTFHVLVPSVMTSPIGPFLSSIRGLDAYDDAVYVILQSGPILWTLVLMIWSYWAYKQNDELTTSIRIKNNKSLSFVAGGLMIVFYMGLSFLIGRFTPFILAKLGVELNLGNLISPILMISILLISFLLFKISHSSPGIIVNNWHQPSSPRAYKKLFVIATTIFSLITFNYLVIWLLEPKTYHSSPITDTENTVTYILTYLILILFVIPYIIYYRMRRKGQLIVSSN